MPKKLILDCDDTLWNKVLKYKIDYEMKNNNDAVISILQKGLKKV